MYYPYSENKGDDQLRGIREADLRLCFRICKKPVFSRHSLYNLGSKQTGADQPTKMPAADLCPYCSNMQNAGFLMTGTVYKLVSIIYNVKLPYAYRLIKQVSYGIPILIHK